MRLPVLDWPGRGRPVVRDADSGRWRFADAADTTVRPLPATDGDLLIHGEAAAALRALAATRHAGRIRLCYVDPPFNTGNEFAAYDDRTSHAVWLSGMEERVVLGRALLAPGGFFVAHIGGDEQAYLQVLLDEIFGRQNHLATICWQRAPDRTVLGQGSALVTDQVEYLLAYTSDRAAIPADWPRPQRRVPLSPKTLATYARTLAPSPAATLVAEHAGARIYAHDGYELAPVRDVAADFPRLMRTTNQQPESTFQQALLARMRDKNVLYRAEYTQARGKHAGPRSRFYLNGNVVLWLRDIAELGPDGALVRVTDLNNFWPADEIPATGIAGEGGVVLRRGKKPVRLLERIVSAFSRPGDTVLDFFAGSGTTGEVAHRLGRRFILVEAAASATELCAPRLQRAGAAFTLATW